MDSTPSSSRVSHHPQPALYNTQYGSPSSRTSSRTALQSQYHDTSEPPRTPPNHSQGRFKGKAPATTATSRQHTTGRHTAARDDGEPVESDKDHVRGLSWSSVTRDSVVDNLLLSFDKMPGLGAASNKACTSFPYMDDHFDNAATPPRVSTRIAQRARGHTYSSSLSTDMTGADEANGRKLSSRGHRSNSSSSFMDSPAVAPRIRDGRLPVLTRSSSEAQRTAILPRHIARKMSKSSNASSFDFPHNPTNNLDKVGTRPWDRTPIRDNDFTQSAPEITSMTSSILSRGRPVPSQFSAYEGPNQRDGLDTSTTTGTRREDKPQDQSIPQSIRDQASDFVRASNMRTASSQLDQNDQPAHPSVASNHTQVTAGEPTQQRPGFFRRVFGSANRSSSGTEVSKQLSREPSFTNDPSQQPRKRSVPAPAHIASQVKLESRPGPANPVVSKKPSFFRRRKKSFTEDDVPPTIPAHFISSSSQNIDRKPPSSPSASSLRKVLDPYMVDADVSSAKPQVPLSRFAADNGDGDSDSLDMFHSGYTPPPDATLHRNAPMEHRSSVTTKAPVHASSSDAMIAPKPRTPPDSDKLQAMSAETDPRPPVHHTNSFLSDSSDKEGKGKAPSVISAVSDTYGLNGNDTPVSPMGSPIVDHYPGATFYLSPSTINSEFGPINPGATIRAVNSDEQDYGIIEPKGLAIDLAPAQEKDRLWISSASPPGDGTDSSKISLPVEDANRPRNPSPLHQTEDSERKGSVPVVEVNGNEVRPSVDIARHLNAATNAEPTQEDIDRAKKIFAGNEDFVSKSTAAAWLGEKTAVSARTLAAYMSFFDWTGQNILSAMRSFCEKLTLKGESQQVDRVLEAFANRWNECNPNNGFKGPSVIHNICYALLLLNTDQHVASIQHKMTRSEFVKNTLPPIKDAAEKTIKPVKQMSRPSIPWQDSNNSSAPGSPVISPDDADEKSSIDLKRGMKRLSLRPGVGRNDTDPGPGADINNYASNILINYAWEGSERSWLLEVETVLKSFYTSIVADALPLHGASERDGLGSPVNNLSVHPTLLRRTGSVISKAPSEGFSYRGRKTSDTQSLAQRMHSKNRLRQKVYPASTVGSARTSFDDGNSMLSPAGSSMWSRISNGKTQPTMSVESFALTQDFKQSLGFTNALSQAIIREEQEAFSDSESFHRVGSLLEDESLELAGAPWAKEGMVKHKHHLEGPEKKAKERSWNECFAVVEKGYLHLFSFDRATTKISSGTARARARRNTTSAKTTGKTPSVTPSVVGGGNWTDNANEKEQFLLRQTIATTLPSPGYSKTRPYVWALSLPNGAVHLFQVGTAEIAEEFASTANYWSARLSKEPLVGGIDNIEYGWSENVLNPALISNPSSSPPPSRGGHGGHGHSTSNSLSTITNMPRPSTQSSIRTSFDQSFGSKPRLPGDRATISDWRPPASSMLPSQLLEIDQLRSLKAYITSVENELERHNELRGAIPLAYSNANGARLGKVMANWEKKSSYLLKEVVKFRTYIEALEKAVVHKEKVYEERRIREEENAAAKLSSPTSVK